MNVKKAQRKPILFVPVESTPRELDYKLNLARLFCREGFEVIIGNPPFIRDELKYKNYRGLFLEKGMNPLPEYYQSLIDKGMLLYCLSDEGAACPAFSVTYQPAVDALKKAEKIFLWGEAQKADLITRNEDPELINKYIVTGYPGFDLNFPKYNRYHSILRPPFIGSGYILVNTNFGSFNGYSFDQIFEACSTMSPDTKSSIKESYETEEKSFKFFRQWLERIIQKFPNETFLIRPHPVERQDVYNNMANVFKNVFVSREGNASQVISGAKLVIHNDCTTALQSYLAGTPVISLANANIEYTHAKWAIEFGAKPKNSDEAIALVSQILEKGKFQGDLIDNINASAQIVLSQWFCNLGHSTLDIVRIMLDKAKTMPDMFKEHDLKDSRSCIQKIKVFVRKFLPLHYKFPLAGRVSFAKFTEQEIIKRLNLLNQVDKCTVLYTIKKLFPNTYLIAEKK